MSEVSSIVSINIFTVLWTLLHTAVLLTVGIFVYKLAKKRKEKRNNEDTII